MADKTNVYVLGDSPHELDDERGYPFDSPAGRLLRSIIGFKVQNTSFDNVIRDYDHYKEQPSWIAMECCRSLIVKSIEQAKPQVILGLGIQALQWMLNSSDMVGLRGRVFAVRVGSHSCYFMPTYHPQFIIDHAFDPKEPLKSKLGHCLKFDIKKAFDAVTWEVPEIDTPQAARAGIQTFTGHKAGDLPALLKLLSEAARAPVKAIDLETYPLRPYAADAKLLTIALSIKGANFSFAWNHPKAGWAPKQKEAIRGALTEALCFGKVVAHNTPFEVEWLIPEIGKDQIFHDSWECTMMQSHFLDERRGKRGGNDEQFQPNPYQALDFLVKQYFGISYKSLFKLNKKRMDLADLDETLIYNGADTKYTLRLYYFQKALLKEYGLWDAYVEARPRQPTMALMQSIGINISQKLNRQYSQGLGAVISLIESEINEFPEVQKYEKETRQKFNPASQPELLHFLKSYLKVGKAILNADGKETTDKGALAKIAHPIGKLVEDYRGYSKLKSTYVDPFEIGKGQFIWPDARIHPSFNTTFAETGRTSSDEPNQQNWPARKDKWVRTQIYAPPGHVLVAFDYGQLEACTTAMCTLDKVLTKALWEDYDIHLEWAQRAAKLYPEFIGGKQYFTDKPKMKEFRSLIKNKLVFPAFFGAKNESVNGYLCVATGLEVPTEITDRLMNDFWQTFNGVGNWQRRVMNDYYNCGYVSSPTGRRRHYPLTKNQAVNYPIQSVACDVVCRAMVNLSRLAIDSGRYYLHPIMNIHDDLTFCIPDKLQILEEAIETIYRTMLAPVYDFINVPLSVTGSVGDNWLDMDEIGKFWSHKDL